MTMNSSHNCEECGTVIPAESTGGFCARCLLALALEPGPPPADHEGSGDNRASHGPIAPKPGERIGRYRLLQEIGQGGCGVVYMAEQEQPVRRRVALKVIKLGMDTRQV